MHTSFTKDAWTAFRQNDRPGPIHMLNLIRLRKWADYGDGRKVTDSNGQSSATYTLPATWTAASGSITVTVTGTSLSATFVFFAIP